MIVPKSIQGSNEKFAIELNEDWQALVQEIQGIAVADEDKSTRIESACRILWRLWNDEDKRQALGWAAWEDIFFHGNEELTQFFELIEDRITLKSASNQTRFYNLLMIDSDPTMAELHLLKRRHWTPITQFESRISRLKQLMMEPDNEEKKEKAEEIIAPKPQEKKDESPEDGDFELKKDTGYWRGKKAIKLQEDNPLALKLKSRLTLVKAFFFLKKADSRVFASTDDEMCDVATVLLPQSDPDYGSFVEWLDDRFGVKIVN